MGQGTTVSDTVLDGPHGPLPVRVYQPAGPSRAGLVWAHGGAFSGGDLDMPEADWVARCLAEAGIAVVSVGYRLAPVPAELAEAAGIAPRPGVHFPVAVEEVAFAFSWAWEAEFGSPGPKWSIGGASAGGTLAAGASLMLRDAGGPQPRTVVLAYPLVHFDLPAARGELAAKVADLPAGPIPEPVWVRAINVNYLGEQAMDWIEAELLEGENEAAEETEKTDPLERTGDPAGEQGLEQADPEEGDPARGGEASEGKSGESTGTESGEPAGEAPDPLEPIASEPSPYAFPGGFDLQGLPPTFVLNADADGLRASGEAYAAELAAAGVDVLQIREDGTRHGHLNDPDDPAAARSLARIVAWLTSTDLVGVPHEGEPSGD